MKVQGLSLSCGLGLLYVPPVFSLPSENRAPGKVGNCLVMLIDKMKLIVQSQIYFEDLYYLETLYDHIKQDTASSSGPHSLFLFG